MEPKKLRRSRDSKIGGVCGGVADYFGLDSTIVRLIWVLTVLLAGTGLLLYLLMWILVPQE